MIRQLGPLLFATGHRDGVHLAIDGWFHLHVWLKRRRPQWRWL